MERKKAFGEIFLQSMKSTQRLKAEDGPTARVRANGSR
jgi:hypothetical protein